MSDERVQDMSTPEARERYYKSCWEAAAAAGNEARARLKESEESELLALRNNEGLRAEVERLTRERDEAHKWAAEYIDPETNGGKVITPVDLAIRLHFASAAADAAIARVQELEEALREAINGAENIAAQARLCAIHLGLLPHQREWFNNEMDAVERAELRTARMALAELSAHEKEGT